MAHVSKRTKRRILAFLLSMLAAFLINLSTPPLRECSTAFYIGIVLAWGLTAWERILSRPVRLYLVLGTFFLVALFALRALRYDLPPAFPRLSRYLWYAYYVPMTGASLCFFSAALFVGREDVSRLPPWARALWGAWVLLVCGVLCNDLHGAAFQIQELGGGEYSYRTGPLYVVCQLWCYSLILAAVCILLRRCRLSRARRQWYYPVLAAALPALGLVFYLLAGGSPQVAGHKLYNFQEVYGCLLVWVWEGCVQIGLVPSNTDYGDIFRRSPWSALLTDRQGEVAYRSAGAPAPTRVQLTAALSAPVAMDGDHVLHSAPIRGGVSYWVEDLTEINRINDRIADAIEELEGENDLLEAENRIRMDRAAYEFQNRLYDGITPIIRPQLTRAEELMEGEEGNYRPRLLQAMLLCVYAKRRVNLALTAHDRGTLSLRELAVALRETTDCLALAPIPATVESGPSAELDAQQVLMAYDFFEEALERSMPDLSALLVSLEAEEGLSIHLTMETPTAAVGSLWRTEQLSRMGAVLTQERDGALYARLQFPKRGGETP